MWRNAHDTYLEERILSSDPVELVGMLYQAAIASIGDARRHLAEGDILARARSFRRAAIF
ncbi:MAG: flagellar protein FliS [Ignavibacteriota bacterium]